MTSSIHEYPVWNIIDSPYFEKSQTKYLFSYYHSDGLHCYEPAGWVWSPRRSIEPGSTKRNLTRNMLLIKSKQAVFFFFICLIITGVILNCSRGLWLWAYCHGIYPFMVVEYCNDGLTHSFQRTSYCSRRIPLVLFCDVSHQYSFYQPRMVSLSYWDSKIGGDTDYHISLCVVFFPLWLDLCFSSQTLQIA